MEAVRKIILGMFKKTEREIIQLEYEKNRERHSRRIYKMDSFYD